MNDISSYRGGYTKALRREVECALFNEGLLGIVSTSAMELGVDIGDLDCTLHAGYSGMASLWQQSGRAGRGQKGSSMAIFVATNSVVDQYIVNHSHFVFESELENTVIYPFNRRIWSQHLLCSIADQAMDRREIESVWTNPEDPGHGQAIEAMLAELAENEQIVFDHKIKKWLISPKYRAILALRRHQSERVHFAQSASSHRLHPAKWIGIRSIDDVQIAVIDGHGQVTWLLRDAQCPAIAMPKVTDFENVETHTLFSSHSLAELGIGQCRATSFCSVSS